MSLAMLQGKRHCVCNARWECCHDLTQDGLLLAWREQNSKIDIASQTRLAPPLDRNTTNDGIGNSTIS